MQNNIDNLVKMILSSSDEDQINTGMGKVLHEFATKPSKLLESNDKDSDELAVMVSKLKDCEIKGKLAWMEYSSWYNLNSIFQNVFMDCINPLFCSNIFFDYSLLENNFIKIIKNISKNVIYITKVDGNVRKLVCFSDNVRFYTMKSESQFSSVSKEVKDNLREIWYQKDGRINIITKDSLHVKEFR